MTDSLDGATVGIHPEPRLAEIGARVAQLRAEMAASPMGRYKAGRDAARTELDTDRRAAEQAAVTWAVRVGALLRAVHDHNHDAARAELAALPLSEVADLLVDGATLARLCAERMQRPIVDSRERTITP